MQRGLEKMTWGNIEMISLVNLMKGRLKGWYCSQAAKDVWMMMGEGDGKRGLEEEMGLNISKRYLV